MDTIVTPALAIIVILEMVTGIGRAYLESRFGF
jgi:hypothetical protein